MSSILKALEKVEESHGTRRNGGVSGLARGRERRRAWMLPAAVLGGAAVAALATFAVMGGFSRHATPVAQQQVEVAKVAPVAVSPGMPIGAPAVQPEQMIPLEQAEVVVVPDPKASLLPGPTSAAKARRVPALPAARPDVVPPSAEHTAPAKAITPTPLADELEVVQESAAPVPEEKARPEIRVTGIAWQNDSRSSIAMVNGRSVQQGGMVDGFKVEEIYEDKVRFSGSKGKLEVQLGGGE